MVVTVGPEDSAPMRSWREWSFRESWSGPPNEAGEGKIPVQLFGDFLKNQKSVTLGEVEPQNKGQWQFGDVRGIFPERLSRSLAEGISSCEYLIPGFSRPDAVLSGVESRTSSPVHIERDENLQSTVKGLYPCGEGAGYAGGITSAAMDGIKVAERVAALLGISL